MTKIVPREVRFNNFDKETYYRIVAMLEAIPEEYYTKKDTAKIMQLVTLQTRWTRQEMMWIVAVDPAYFVQYKKNSCAQFLISGVVVIAYRPKYLEYPQIVNLPVVDENAPSPVVVELVSQGAMTTDSLVQTTKKFVEGYYAKFHSVESPSDFETGLVRNLKHYLSRYAKRMYWHCMMGTAKSQVYQFAEIENHIKFKVNKHYIYAFSVQGLNDPVRNIIRNKWKELLTFVFLFVLLMTVVACPRQLEQPVQSEDPYVFQDQASSVPQFCAHRSTIYYIIGGFFFILTGMKFAKRKKPTLPNLQPTATHTKTE